MGCTEVLKYLRVIYNKLKSIAERSWQKVVAWPLNAQITNTNISAWCASFFKTLPSKNWCCKHFYWTLNWILFVKKANTLRSAFQYFHWLPFLNPPANQPNGQTTQLPTNLTTHWPNDRINRLKSRDARAPKISWFIRVSLLLLCFMINFYFMNTLKRNWFKQLGAKIFNPPWRVQICVLPLLPTLIK